MREERSSDIYNGKIKWTKEEQVSENQLAIFMEQVFTDIEY